MSTLTSQSDYSLIDFRFNLISCFLSGILSILREISRTFQGEDLRRAIVPSLPISTSMKPRGLSCFLISDFLKGSVSISTTTSLFISVPGLSFKSFICLMKLGSCGLSANTKTTLLIKIKSCKLIFSEPKSSNWITNFLSISSALASNGLNRAIAKMKINFMGSPYKV